MIPEGKLHIRLGWDGSAIRHAEITPRRLADVARLLRGKEPQQAAALIPLMFSLCGRAQGVAATLALSAAQGIAAVSPAQERAVLAEAFQESAWRFLIDLPQRYGLPAEAKELAGLRQLCGAELLGDELAEALEAFLIRRLLGLPVRDWRTLAEQGESEAWLAHTPAPFAEALRLMLGEGDWGTSDIPLLPNFTTAEVTEEILPALLDQADFAIFPTWRGNPAETGSLARHGIGGNIADRLVARLRELAWVAERLRGSGTLPSGWLKHARTGENTGLAWVQTARGLLIHYAQVKNGVVTDYRIVAPTEWNFHPRGAFARGLAGQSAATPEEARRRAELLLFALDPCVEYEIGIDHA